ncbi:MAG: hypothetical protein QOI98_751, partial [Solirubrobacteraceae bacterium]|nr:hypothetical protein [Solirubrobacteraceae bacterium]
TAYANARAVADAAPEVEVPPEQPAAVVDRGRFI